MRALLAVACAALVLVSASVEVEAQPTLGAPAISSVTAGTNDLTVVWTAPAEDGGATITSYDVRYIESDAADKADANWSVLEGIWSSGTLSYKVAGLYDGTGYDIEVRADNGANGPWSATSTGTTTDHGGTTTAATTVTLGSSTPGRIKPASDSDVFRFTLTGEADVWSPSTGRSCTPTPAVSVTARMRSLRPRCGASSPRRSGWTPRSTRASATGGATSYLRGSGTARSASGAARRRTGAGAARSRRSPTRVRR